MKERYKQIVARMRAIHERVMREKRNYTDSENVEFENLDDEAKKLRPQIERERGISDSESDLHRMDFDTDAMHNERGYRTGYRKTPLSGYEDSAADAPNSELNVRSYAWNEPLKPTRPYQPLPDGIRAEDLSLARLIRGTVTGNWRNAELEHRAMGEGTGSLGGFWVPDMLSNLVIDLARAKSVVQRAGGRTIQMPTPEMAIARVKSDPIGLWRAENQTIEESDATWDRILLHAWNLAVLVRTSVELLSDATNLETMIRANIASAIAVQLDAIALTGDGVGKPIGILSCDGVTEISMGTNGAVLSDYAPFSRGVQSLLEANAPSEGLSVIHSPRSWGTLDRLVETTTGAPLRPPVSYTKMLELVTTSIPTNQTKGSATTCSTSLIGAWEWLLLGMHGPIMIEASRQAGTAFEKAQVLIRCLVRCDTAVVRPNHFAKITGIKGT